MTPTLAGYDFDPSYRSYSNVTTGMTTGQDYTATLQTFTISGKVNSGEGGLKDVVMSGLPGNPKTDVNGDYSGTVDHGWSGTVMPPTKDDYTFSPSSNTYTSVTEDKTGEDYIVVSAPAGKVELAGPSYVGGGFISEAFSLESQDGFGNPVNVTANTTFDISSDSGGIVNFYSEPSGTTTPISQVTIANGTSSATFYYEDTLAGTPTVTAAWDSGGTDLGSDTHQITVDVVVGQIAFVSERDGNKEIYVVNADGSGQTRLTDNSADDCKPSWRPQPRIIPHSYEFVSEWGSQGSEEGQFNNPAGIAVDSSGYVYVVDSIN